MCKKKITLNAIAFEEKVMDVPLIEEKNTGIFEYFLSFLKRLIIYF